MFCRAPNNGNIRVYGFETLSYQHETQKSHIFDDRAERRVYMGSFDGMHRLYIRKHQTQMTSKHPLFNENVLRCAVTNSTYMQVDWGGYRESAESGLGHSTESE